MITAMKCTTSLRKYFSENEVLDMCAMISNQYEDRLDVLVVLLLQVDAGVERPLLVIPLFKVLDDLRGASVDDGAALQAPGVHRIDQWEARGHGRVL
jgi:phosphoenolpyruvate carboxylase